MATAPAPIDILKREQDGNSEHDGRGTQIKGGKAQAKVTIQTAEPTAPEKIAEAVLHLIRKERKEGIDDLISAIVDIRTQLIQQRQCFQREEQRITEELKSKTNELDNLKKRNLQLEEKAEIINLLEQKAANFDRSRRRRDRQEEVVKQKRLQLEVAEERHSAGKSKEADELVDFYKNRALMFEKELKEAKRSNEEFKEKVELLEKQLDIANERWSRWDVESGGYMYQDDIADLTPFNRLSGEDQAKRTELEQKIEICNQKLKEDYSEDEIKILKGELDHQEATLQKRKPGTPKYGEAKEKYERAKEELLDAQKMKEELERDIQSYQEQINDIIEKQATDQEKGATIPIPKINYPSSSSASRKTGNRAGAADSAIGGMDSPGYRSRAASMMGGDGDAGEICRTCGQRRWSVT